MRADVPVLFETGTPGWYQGSAQFPACFIKGHPMAGPLASGRSCRLHRRHQDALRLAGRCAQIIPNRHLRSRCTEAAAGTMVQAFVAANAWPD